MAEENIIDSAAELLENFFSRTVELLENFFSRTKPYNDVALVVEEKEIWVSRAALSYYSPVFERMFYGDFKESVADRIPLPNKSFVEMFGLIQCLIPCPVQADITWDNVTRMLELADEYDVKDLKRRAQIFLKSEVDTLQWKDEKVFKILSLTGKYKFDELTKRCLPFATTFTRAEVEAHFEEVPVFVTALLYEKLLSARDNRVNYTCNVITCNKCNQNLVQPRMEQQVKFCCCFETSKAVESIWKNK